MKETRILIIDDYPLVRQGLMELIQQSLSLVIFGEAAKASEAFALLSQSWDLVLLDLSLAGDDGFQVLKELRSLRPNLPAVVVSMHSEEHYAVRALKAGAAGFVNKAEACEALLKAMEAVLQGRTYTSDRVAEQLAQDVVFDSHRRVDRILSARELEVLNMLGTGQEREGNLVRFEHQRQDGRHVPGSHLEQASTLNNVRNYPVRYPSGGGSGLISVQSRCGGTSAVLQRLVCGSLADSGQNEDAVVQDGRSGELLVPGVTPCFETDRFNVYSNGDVSGYDNGFLLALGLFKPFIIKPGPVCLGKESLYLHKTIFRIKRDGNVHISLSAHCLLNRKTGRNPEPIRGPPRPTHEYLPVLLQQDGFRDLKLLSV